MLEFLIASSISCAQAQEIISRIETNESLTNTVKTDLVNELKKHSRCRQERKR